MWATGCMLHKWCTLQPLFDSAAAVTQPLAAGALNQLRAEERRLVAQCIARSPGHGRAH